MAIIVRIDSGACCGWGNCAQVCPEMFELDPETNRAKLRHLACPDDLASQVHRAAAECPTQAISIAPAGELP
jgi:ferredoxin